MGGLRIIDVAQSGSLAEVGSQETPGFAYAVVKAGNYAYPATTQALTVYGVADLTVPNPVSYFLGYTADVVVAEKLAYLFQESTLWIVDISEPLSPTQVGALSFPLHPQGYVRRNARLVVRENHAYIFNSKL